MTIANIPSMHLDLQTGLSVQFISWKMLVKSVAVVVVSFVILNFHRTCNDEFTISVANFGYFQPKNQFHNAILFPSFCYKITFSESICAIFVIQLSMTFSNVSLVSLDGFLHDFLFIGILHGTLDNFSIYLT